MTETAASKDQTRPAAIQSARKALDIETAGLHVLSSALDGPLGTAFQAAVATIQAATGRVVMAGIGKSGHIARKIAATLASTGTPALYIHPSEASHGDLGMIAPEDVLVVLSNSGETAELKDMVAYSRRFSVPLIAMTGRPDSTLAKGADVVLALPEHEEACPIGLAPTTSTTMQLALGDALAVALLEEKGFTAQDFKQLHPGGKLGAQLAFVRDIMHGPGELPLADIHMPMSQALVVMTQKSFGCLGIVDDEGALAGIITDGDLRRHMSGDLLSARTGDIMTRDPLVVGPDEIAFAALKTINTAKITSLFVVEDGKPVGILHIHDLLRIGAG